MQLSDDDKGKLKEKKKKERKNPKPENAEYCCFLFSTWFLQLLLTKCTGYELFFRLTRRILICHVLPQKKMCHG